MSHHTRFVAILAFLLLLGALGVLAGGLFILERAQRTLQTEKAEVAAVQAYEIAMLQLSREFESTVEERAALRSFFVPHDRIVDFLALIEGVGAKQGVTITTAALGVVEEGPVHDTLELEVRARGSRTGVLHVLETLESLPYASHVRSAHIETAGEGASLWEGIFTIIVAQHKQP